MDPLKEPMSGTRLSALLPGRTYAYGDLKSMIRLPERPFALLYEQRPRNGHWILVHDTVDDRGSACTEVFDSFGTFPDKTLDLIDPRFRRESGQEHPELIRLLYHAGRQVAYSPFKMQDDEMSTCGRHCVVRSWNDGLSAEAYHRGLMATCKKEKITPDDLVVSMTQGV